jgi:hypothetical protein
MIISFSQGKIIATQHELQCRLNTNAIVMQAMLEDVRLLSPSLLIAADAGVVKWSIKLDNRAQFDALLEATGLAEEHI